MDMDADSSNEIAMDSFWGTAKKLYKSAWADVLRMLSTSTISVVVFSIVIPPVISCGIAAIQVWLLFSQNQAQGKAEQSVLSLFIHGVFGWPALFAVGVTAVAWALLFGVGAIRAYGRIDAERKADEQRYSSELKEALAKKDEDYQAIVRMKDGDFRAAQTENSAKYTAMEHRKNLEIEIASKVIRDYRAIWRHFQDKSHALAIDLREYCELNHAPMSPRIVGESDGDLLERQVLLMFPWTEKVRCDYNHNFAQRVQDVRDDFAMNGFRDIRLEQLIAMGVVHTDSIMEVSDRLMGLALKELSNRQLRTITLKQLCD